MDNEIIILTVSEVNNLIKNIINKKFNESVTIIGEISNFKISRKHVFMNLKDKDSIINVVCWNFIDRFKDISLKNGDKVKIIGYINISPKYGTYNLTALGFELDGTGDLQKEYELTKQKCQEAGFFNNKTKQMLPHKINKIGVITALSGAALVDFKSVLNNGGYKGKLYIKGCNVQGKDCPKTIINSLEYMDNLDLDVIILTRGGGSFEDLFGFCNYELLESIFKTKTCTISAIGHEIDFMLSDFVADIRASTPSVAGEIIYKHQKSLHNLQEYNNLLNKTKYKIQNNLYNYKLNLLTLEKKLVPYDRILDNCQKDINDFYNNINIRLKNRIKDINNMLDNNLIRLENAHPKQILNQGYTLISYPETNELIKSINDLKNFIKTGEKLKIQFKDGTGFITLCNLDIIDE
jgi:exodeoxyribonuclease VII large subunit